MAVSTYRADDLNVDRLLYLACVTALTLERIDHNITASSMFRNPTVLSTLFLLANSEVAGIT